MPRNTRRRTAPRRKKCPPPTYGQIGSKIFKDVERLKNLINVEFKSHDHNSVVKPTTTGHISHVTSIAQGDTSATRDGNQVRIKSWQSCVNYKLHASATFTEVRFIWFIEKRVEGALPLTTDVLTSATITSFRDLESRRNLIILKDKVFFLTTDRPNVNYCWYKVMDMKALYSGTAGDITDADENQLFTMELSTEATNTPTTRVENRIRYIDN